MVVFSCYEGKSRAYPQQRFEPRNFTLRNVLSGLMCTGQENSLFTCNSAALIAKECRVGFTDAGLVCGTTGTYVSVRVW